MKTLKQYQAESGKIYDNEVEAEMDDLISSIRYTLTMYCSDQSPEQDQVIDNVVNMLTKDEDWCDMVIEKIEAYHQNKRQLVD